MSAGENKRTTELLEVAEPGRSTERAVGLFQRIVLRLQVRVVESLDCMRYEPECPSLTSSLGSLSSACARRVVQGVASGQCSDEHSVCGFSSRLVEDSVVPVASDLQQQVPTIQMVQMLVPNILPDPVFPSVAGELERDLEDGVLAVRASSPTAGGGNRFRLLEVIESVFPCLVTRFTNSPKSSLRVSSRARARAICFAPASTRVCPGSSSLAVSAAVAHTHASILHGACHTSWSDTVWSQGPRGRKRVKEEVSGPAEDLRPVAATSQEATRHRNQVAQGRCGQTFPPPRGS